ncbi:hypothetical protein V9T40_014280 [Parthenolecanium corni]|uniref:SHSP domain-containing protein n=1 Tax=Parthenolecanium corni TaxID=536013 RepID=A0AAN9TG30_9HEMI
MALLPHLLHELLHDARERDPVSRLFDQDFGIGLLNDELYRPSIGALTTPLLAGYVRPLRHVIPDDSGVSSITRDKDSFKVNLDVQQFKPEEINVKVVDDFIVVDGKHEERQDKHGFISRQFTRKYKLPPNVNVDAIQSKLSSDGILSIVAPKKAIESGPSRSIPVMKTNQPAIKQNKEAGSGDNEKTES